MNVQAMHHEGRRLAKGDLDVGAWHAEAKGTHDDDHAAGMAMSMIVSKVLSLQALSKNHMLIPSRVKADSRGIPKALQI
ncbi:MAG: hypothetical protein R6V26_12420 [Roseovarius sp.]